MNDVNALQPKKQQCFFVDMSLLCTQHVHLNCFKGNLSNSKFIYVSSFQVGQCAKKNVPWITCAYQGKGVRFHDAQFNLFSWVWACIWIICQHAASNSGGWAGVPITKILCLPRAWLYESVVLLLFIRTLSWVYLGRLGGFIRSFSPGAAAFSLAFASFFGFCLVYALLFRKVVSGQQSTGLSLRFTHLRHCATYSLCVLGHHWQPSHFTDVSHSFCG